MAVSKEFLEYVLDLFPGWAEVTAKRMFGGAGLYREGKMFGLIADDMVYFKVDDTNRERYEAVGSSPFVFTPKSGKSTTMSYYELPPEVLENPDELMEWTEGSLAIQKKGK